MGAPTDEFWDREMATLFEEHPRWGPDRIGAALTAIGINAGRADTPPGQRTISTKKKAHSLKPAHERLLYRYFYWPESMGTVDLPWEASRPLLDMLAVAKSWDSARPTIRFARWYWRLHQAAPRLTQEARYGRITLYVAAGELAAAEAAGASMESTWRAIEAWLAFEPWTERGLEIYEAMVRRGVPRWSGYEYPAEAPPEAVAAVIRERTPGLTEQEASEMATAYRERLPDLAARRMVWAAHEYRWVAAEGEGSTPSTSPARTRKRRTD